MTVALTDIKHGVDSEVYSFTAGDTVDESVFSADELEQLRAIGSIGDEPVAVREANARIAALEDELHRVKAEAGIEDEPAEAEVEDEPVVSND